MGEGMEGVVGAPRSCAAAVPAGFNKHCVSSVQASLELAFRAKSGKTVADGRWRELIRFAAQLLRRMPLSHGHTFPQSASHFLLHPS